MTTIYFFAFLFLFGMQEEPVEDEEIILKTAKSYFIVVGAAHLVGKTGLPTLLKDAGFEVKQHEETIIQ